MSIGIGIGIPFGRYYGAGGWTPAALFASGEQGVWYDPSDFSTMFQDSAGTTPVTATGQPVGLILDKSKGLVLGPDIVVNGNFATDTVWTKSVAVITGGQAVIDPNGFVLQDIFTTEVGRWYKITLDIVSVSGSVNIFCGTTSSSNPAYYRSLNTVGTHTVYLQTGGNARLMISANAIAGGATVDNVFCKELPGNHATQATAAKRPVLQQDGGGHYYLDFDGVDDWLASTAIDFTATSNMGIFGGVTRSTTDNYQMIAEQGALYIDLRVPALWSRFATEEWGQSIGTNSDSFKVFVPSTVLPTTAVLSATYNTAISAYASYVLRVNTSEVGRNISGILPDVGNFMDYALYIGARSLGSSGYLNGRIYSLIVRGAVSDATTIDNTEAWVNDRTGAY